MSGTGREPIRVLHVDDDPSLAETAALYLQKHHDRFEVLTETSASDGLDRLTSTAVDCIVSDYDMPRMDGLDFLEAVRERDPGLPFVLFTGKGSEEIASEAISAGVTEYLQKGGSTDQYTLLANRIERAVAENRAKQALEESERMFSTLISNLPGMVYRARNEPDWPMEFVSDGCRDLTGYDPGELEDGTVEWGPDVLHEDDFGTMWDPVQAALDAHEPFEVTYRIRTADDDVKWVWEQGRGVYEDGDLVALEGFVTDITERKRAEQSRRKYETIVETMDDAAFILDTDGRFEFVNEAFREFGGFDPEEAVGEDGSLFEDEVTEDTRRRYGELVDGIASGERSRAETELVVDVNDAGPRTIDLRLTRFEEDGEFAGIIGIARDVTDRKERERELTRYRELVETVGDPMYVADAAGYLEMVNEAFVSHLGAPREAIVGSHMTDVMDEADFERGSAILRDLLAGDEREWGRFEFAVEFEDDIHRYETNMTPLTTDDGRLDGSVGVIRDVTERRERELELRQYRTIMEAAGDPVYALDADGVLTMANEAMAEVIGLDAPDEAIGRSASDLLVDETVERAREEIRALLSDDRDRAIFETPLVPDTDRVFEVDMAVLEGPDGAYEGTVGIIREVTERIERERELERYEMLVENVGDPMYALEPDGTVSMVNEAMADHLDCEPDDLVGEPVSVAMSEDDVQTGTELIADLLADDERRWGTFEMETVSFEGERTINEDKIGVLTDEDGTYTGSVGVIRDISDLKERERELERYETIIQAVGDPVYALDTDGCYTFLNDAILEKTGYSTDELLGEHVSVMLDEADVREGERLIRDLLESEDRSNATYEMDLVTKDGDRIPTENHLALLPFDEDGAFRGTAGVVRDITERKQRERRLEQFASVVSHDLRNPLNVIEGRIELVQETGDRENLDDALASVDRMRRLIDDLLTLAREGEAVGDVEPIELGAVADRAWRSVDTRAATLELGDLGTAPADDERLQELFENLYRNAVEHGGDEVAVTVDSLDDGRGFYVADDGPGISEDERDIVFEHGFSTSKRGTGFGLSIVENIATAHGWDVSVAESAAGGARFEVTY
jgi:PAS domain S-box-containing protein